MSHNRFIRSDSVDPWHNLALEEYLFDTQGADGVTLYLWQNENTVVIGRNQNAWKECRVALLESEGGRLARRSSGGGAVFHDLGNLNFTFILPRENYDVRRQLSVLQSAVQAFGVETLVSGRNDMTIAASGAKFSGNAFRFTSNTAMHHGTILISADMEKIGRYLAPSQQKLRAKGIESVRSRVENLNAHNAQITVPAMTEAMRAAFELAYGKAEEAGEGAIDSSALDGLTARYASWEWRFGKTPQFDITLSQRFDWGEIELLLTCRNGCVEHCTVFSDAMDADLPRRIEQALENAPFDPKVLAARVKTLSGVAEEASITDLSAWLGAQPI